MYKKVVVWMVSYVSVTNVSVCGVGAGGWEHMYVQACLCVCEGQRSMLNVFLDCSPPCLLRQDLFLNLEFVDLARLAGR